MRAKAILTLCCFVALLLTGAVLSAEPAPTLPGLLVDAAAAAPVCSAAPALSAKPDLGGGPGAAASCPASVYQACFQRYGTCTLCYCFGGACSCENRCV